MPAASPAVVPRSSLEAGLCRARQSKWCLLGVPPRRPAGASAPCTPGAVAPLASPEVCALQRAEWLIGRGRSGRLAARSREAGDG